MQPWIIKLAGPSIWQFKHDKIIEIQTQGYKSTNFAAYGRVQKVKSANSKAVEGTLSYYYKAQSQKYSIN